ncbi:helix-turn-helix transcriptional regulator [Amycolatopsis magusensis]|uniref:helix-turn-helix transcriptional regulator n=1 Tax=Amycolatopsis magusensis TaxID=882444 RepID=UPI0024A9DF45|nr:helix-turn-helix domain-containing protein [Amycolatopsis magusensis]MDI5975554.1 helix-turn-helix transcriptional regulator [Amycolatopsis magusensis]
MRQELAGGLLIVRASGADAVKAALTGAQSAPERIQLLLGCPVPQAAAFSFGDCSLQTQPGGVVLLTVPEARLTIGFAELRPLMFQPVEVAPALRSVFAGAVAQLLAAGHALDPHGLAHHLLGLAELVLRSALRSELDRSDAAEARRREAVAYMRAHLADPTLSAERIADALFVSRRRLYQLFDDGQGVSERIRVMRIEKAKALLADPAKAARGIAEISRDCGFTNATHFSRSFRKLVGETPREFRERAR